MSTELNQIDIEQSSQTDELMKVDLMKIDDNLKSNITCELYDTLIDPECKKSKLSDVWETSHTPPLECQEYDSLKVKKDLYKDITTNVNVVVDDDNLKKFHDTEKIGSCYRHTDDYEIYHSSIEKDICTELDNPMYIPIKLPMSSNLYVPVYYVQSSEETSPKLNKHNLDFNDSNNIHKDSNNNNNIKSMVSHKYQLNSHDNLSKQNESQRLSSDYHINTNNQGYENYLSKYDTTKPEPNPYDLEICNVQTELNEPLMKTKHSEKSKTSKVLLKQKLHFMKPKLKMNMNNKENEIVILDSQGKITDENNKIEKRQKIGCSPKLKFKKHEHPNRNDLEVMQRNDKPVEGVISGKQYKIPDLDSNNQPIEHEPTETSGMENKKVTRKTKILHRNKNEVKENEIKTAKGAQKKERRITDYKAKKEKGTEDAKQSKIDGKIEKKKEKRMMNPCVNLNRIKINKTITTRYNAEKQPPQEIKIKKEKLKKGPNTQHEKVKSNKFHWSPNISLPKLKVHGPDVSGKLHADAPDVNVNVTGPSVEVPSLKASGHLPTVDVSVPDASLGGDLSGKLDLDGVGVGVVDADLNLPDLQISGNVSAPSVEGDLSMPDVSANLDTDVKLPSVQLTGPDLRVHGEMPDVDVGAKVDVPKPHISIKAPKFGFGLGKKKPKVKTPKADVKVEGGAGGEIDLDAGLDAHLDGKARKGGKKFHWSPKFGLPKGGLKIGGGAGVGVPDTSVSVSGTTGGVDVSLPKPELDVSMEVPDVDVSASVPEIDVSGGVIRGGELGLTGKVSAPDVDVSVPSKKKFTFGWGSKGKKAKKVKLPTVSGDVDASLDVGGKVDVPSVKVDVDSGDRVKGKKFHWSPNISLPKLKVHGPDVSGKLHADAPDVNVNVTGPSVEVPSLKASGHLPTVDVSVPDASLGGDLSGKLDLDGVGVGVVDADLNLPDLQISGNVSAPSVEGDLSMPDVSANLDTDVKLPSVQLTGPDLRVHGEMPDVDVGAKVDVPKPHISIKAPKFGFGLGKKKPKVKTPKADVKVEGGAGGEIDLDAGLDAHLDGKARKGGKKFHWSPKFGLPKGGLKIGGGAGVGVPDTSVSVSGTTGGVDVSLPKPELDVSMEVPDVDVSASVPEIDVSGGVIRGGELGLTGKVSAPDVDVSVPSKKKFTFGWGSKGKKAKKVKLPTVSGDVDASLDVGGKVDVPSVKVDVDSGDRVKGKKFHWSPNISLPKLKVHGPDVSGKLHADAPDVNVNVTGPSVEVPSLKASGHLPTVDVSVPDASVGR
ncbi:unnamed protein product [Schistosoma spindalis]|nr:unnamed protein product [Schistosoma spindale]